MSALEISHNEGQITKYLEIVWPLIEKGLVMPEEPPDRKHKGSSRAPATDRALGIMEANRDATSKLEPILQEAKRSSASLGGIAFSSLLLEVTENPVSVGRFRISKRNDYKGEEGKRAKAFFGMCKLFAYAIAARYDGPGGPCKLWVKTRPKDEEEEEDTEQADDPRNLGYGVVRSLTAHDSYRTMVLDMERMVMAGTHSKEGAKAAKADRLGCSMSRVKDAITFVNKERQTVFDKENGDGAAA